MATSITGRADFPVRNSPSLWPLGTLARSRAWMARCANSCRRVEGHRSEAAKCAQGSPELSEQCRRTASCRDFDEQDSYGKPPEGKITANHSDRGPFDCHCFALPSVESRKGNARATWESMGSWQEDPERLVQLLTNRCSGEQRPALRSLHLICPQNGCGTVRSE